MGPGTSPSHQGSTRKGPILAIAMVGILVGAGVTVYLLTTDHAPSAPAPPTKPPSANATLTGLTGPSAALANGRLGVNVRADVPLDATSANALNATEVRLIRWPGGGLGDRFDPIVNQGTGAVYDANGTPSPPDTSFAQFVAWCRSVGCESIVTLPAETDNASLAEAIVQYSLSSLHFRPTYWEVGNEPELWTHFHIAWTGWRSTQNSTTTPAGFASLVHAFVSAIRAADPVTPIVGIGGVGAGASQAAWIEDDVAMNGPNLSAVAIHVYPAGRISGPTPLATWFGSLGGSSALPSRVNGTLASLNRTCPSCRLTLLVDEVGTGTLVPRNDELSGGYLGAYVGAELVQSLGLDVGTLAYYNLQSETAGAWFSSAGTPSASYAIYQDWARWIGPFAAPLGTSSHSPGLLAAVGGPDPGNLMNLILVNTNSSIAFRLNLSQAFPGAAGASVEIWNGSQSNPSPATWGTAQASDFTLAPMSLAMFAGMGLLQVASRGSVPSSVIPIAPSSPTVRLLLTPQALNAIQGPRDCAVAGVGFASVAVSASVLATPARALRTSIPPGSGRAHRTSLGSAHLSAIDR